jgi:citrate lyase beta subunit
MKTSLTPDTLSAPLARLSETNHAMAQRFPGESGRRQPVHTVYGGAHLFKSDSAAKLGALAVRVLDTYAPDFGELARAVGMTGADTLPSSIEEIGRLKSALEEAPDALKRGHRAAWLAYTIHHRVAEKLRREAVEDFRIDFEDGYGNRSDSEEDGHAQAAAVETAKGLAEGTLPFFIGIRVKPFTEELRERAVRTLDLYLTTLLHASGNKLPANFVVTLPKVTSPVQVSVLADLLELIEQANGLEPGALKLELMIETTQSIINERGEVALPRLIEAARGRCIAAHFGTYDYTASCSITAAWQKMGHPACDFAKHVMQVALAGTGIWLSDGATTTMPIGQHKAGHGGGALTAAQLAENRATVHRAWRMHYEDVMHSLAHAYYQGWDLHPGQLCTRYAAVFAFFLEGKEDAADRLRNFVEKAAQATLVGDIFDDAATGQGLLNFFLRAVNCGAITEDEALALTGVTLEELRGRSFVRILGNRRAAKA